MVPRSSAENCHFPNPASLGFLFCECSHSGQSAQVGCLERPVDRHRHGAWRAAWVMLAFLRFGVHSGIWRPAMFPRNKTASCGPCCQANLDLWGLFHRFQLTDVAAQRALGSHSMPNIWTNLGNLGGRTCVF